MRIRQQQQQQQVELKREELLIQPTKMVCGQQNLEFLAPKIWRIHPKLGSICRSSKRLKKNIISKTRGCQPTMGRKNQEMISEKSS
jgi:hypothetical protein